jgi:hypothetical protein
VSAEEFLVISNNPAVGKIKRAKTKICLVEGDCLAVLYQAFSIAASGYTLLSHPLAGSIKPEDNYYRSIVFSAEPKDQVDLIHLRLLDKCLLKLEERQNARISSERLALYTQDLQIMDIEFLNSALNALEERIPSQNQVVRSEFHAAGAGPYRGQRRAIWYKNRI